MINRTVMINGVNIPRFLYGTAWKEGRTSGLTELSLQLGFRGIDTANQRRHYDEAAVGHAISASIARGLVTRDDLFLQTKFTFRRGQDHRLPYDPESPIPIQVRQSFDSSLRHLSSERVDSYLLHGPTATVGITADDWAAWRAMEEIHDSGGTRLLGVSNVKIDQLQRLWKEARIRPSIVQNRCYASSGWDRRVREFCVANELVYQCFSLLTANRDVLASAELARIAKHHGQTTAQIIFRFALEVGIIPLTGTTNTAHMQADLDVFGFCLERDEIEQIQNLGAR
jgi:diketogulonate reductase-like aldo/keto reductase